MFRTRRTLFAAFVLVAGVVVFQMTRHRLQADDGDETATEAAPLSCASTRAAVEPGKTSPRSEGSAVLRMDFGGAEALPGALERDSLSELGVDSLLRVPGLCATVANVARYFPRIGAPEFSKEIRSFVRKKNGGRYDGYFGLTDTWTKRAEIGRLVAAIRSNEAAVASEVLNQLEAYRPDTGAFAVTAYFVAGGVSDGFAFENDPTSFYANLTRAKGDLNGVIANMAHEAYHVMQFRAQRGKGVPLLSAAADTMAPVARLFATTLSEGTANYVVDPTRSTASGPQMDSARARYRRNADAKRIAQNFARFDDVLAGLHDGRLSWAKAYDEGFSGDNDAIFYFVGYEMAKAIDRDCGPRCIAKLFAEPPVAFFRRYIALYQQHPEVTGRFSRETEALIGGYGRISK